MPTLTLILSLSVCTQVAIYLPGGNACKVVKYLLGNEEFQICATFDAWLVPLLELIGHELKTE